VTTGHGEKMGRKFEQAIAALLDRPTVTEAAAAVGVDESTLRTWLRDAEFQAAYATARREVLERTVARLLAITGEAVEALRRNLTAEKSADQLRAAALILEYATRGVEGLGTVDPALPAAAALVLNIQEMLVQRGSAGNAVECNPREAGNGEGTPAVGG